MTGQSVSFHLRTLFELALEDYEIKTQISLAEHPLAQKLENCHSIESIATLLQDQARTFGEFRGRDRMMKSIRNIVSFLYKLSATTTLIDGISLVRQKTLMTVFHVSDFVLQPCPPARALHTGLGVLLAVCLSSNPPWRIRSDRLIPGCTRRPRAWSIATAHSSTSLKRLNTFLKFSMYIRRFLQHLPWTS